MEKNYLNEILKTSKKYLEKVFTKEELESLLQELKDRDNETNEEVIRMFMDTYHKHMKIKFQKEDSPNHNKELYSFLKEKTDKVKIYWGDVYDFLKKYYRRYWGDKIMREKYHYMVVDEKNKN